MFACTAPCCNFLDNECCCYGGFEVVVRYEMLDFNDGAINGGEMTTIVAGINWHMNPNARIMVNWFTNNVEGGNFNINDESYTGIGVRFQVNW